MGSIGIYRERYSTVMLNIFKQHIVTEIELILVSEENSFEPFKKTKSIARFKKQYNAFTAFVELEFPNNKDYVIPSLFWSKRNRFPKKNSFPMIGFRDYRARLAELDSREDIMLTAIEFGEYTNAVDLGEQCPLRTRLEELYQSKEGEAAIKDYKSTGFDSWQKDEILQSWDMLELYFPNILNLEDAVYATSKTVADVQNIILNLFLPYLADVDDRMHGKK